MWPVVWKPPEVWEQSTQEKASLVQRISLSGRNLDVHLICDIKKKRFILLKVKRNVTYTFKLHAICSSLYFWQEAKFPDGNKHLFSEQSAHESPEDEQSSVNYYKGLKELRAALCSGWMQRSLISGLSVYIIHTEEGVTCWLFFPPV